MTSTQLPRKISPLSRTINDQSWTYLSTKYSGYNCTHSQRCQLSWHNRHYAQFNMMAHSISSETKITFSMVSLQFITFLHNQDHFQHGCHSNQDHNSMVHSNSTLIRSQQCVYQLKTSENNKWVCPSRSQETDWRSNDVFCDVTPLRILLVPPLKIPSCATGPWCQIPGKQKQSSLRPSCSFRTYCWWHQQQANFNSVLTKINK